MTVYLVYWCGSYYDEGIVWDSDLIDIFKDEDSAKRFVKKYLMENGLHHDIDIESDTEYYLEIPFKEHDETYVYYTAHEVH